MENFVKVLGELFPMVLKGVIFTFKFSALIMLIKIKSMCYKMTKTPLQYNHVMQEIKHVNF